ncbi:hypothetical protein [uncultured Parolsenella sp.]|uniref:AAA family ATPase n=1 Tax=uncultured Parolsenella sp. TaxID=2083008 RepID=UPI002805C423|nr:hypothetical protein [uncultured Parolsenella sp.]
MLKLRVDGLTLFKNKRLELDFIATDRVSRDEEGNVSDVTQLAGGSAVYTQNVMGIVGVNAAGKTTVLNLVRFVLGYMSGNYVMRQFATGTNLMGKLEDRMAISCVFYEKGSYYLIESQLKAATKQGDSARMGEGARVASLVFEDEWLWACPARMSRRAILDIDQLKSDSTLLLKRNGGADDEHVLNDAQRTFLGDDMSIVSIITGRKSVPVEYPERSLPLVSLPTPVVQAFDSSVEYLNWNNENQVFHLKFKNEDAERVVNAAVATAMLSNGTVVGAELVDRAIGALKSGGYLIVDEIETGLNRSLVGTVIELFASPVTNPHGATLLFSTHYSELLDVLRRKDNVIVLVRNESFETEVIKYSDRIARIENKKSDVIINNVIKGSMPKYPDVRAMRSYVRERVNG